MPLTEQERAYLREYRQRPEVKARDRERARRRRSAPGGAELNRTRVKANRAALGRNYITELVRDQTGLRCRDVPEEVVEVKRQAIEIRRLAVKMATLAIEETQHET